MVKLVIPEFEKTAPCGSCTYEFVNGAWVEQPGGGHCGPECQCVPPPSAETLNAAPSMKKQGKQVEPGDTMDWPCAQNVIKQRDLFVQAYLETLGVLESKSNPLFVPLVVMGVAAVGLAAALAWALLGR